MSGQSFDTQLQTGHQPWRTIAHPLAAIEKLLGHGPAPAFMGYGAQLDTDVFTRTGEKKPLTASQNAKLANTVQQLHPEYSRVFVTPEMLARFVPKGTVDPDTTHALGALEKTLRMAQSSGSEVNLTFWHPPGGGYGSPAQRKALMTGFAKLLASLRKQGITCVHDVTIQNEPDSHDLSHDERTWQKAHPGKAVPATVTHRALNDSLALYGSLYRDLDTALKATPDPKNPRDARGMRDAVKLVGGDLVFEKRANGTDAQDDWLRYMGAHLGDVLDGYSLHVYWVDGPNGRAQAEQRLAHAQAVVKSLPHPKPLYVTEYGVRAVNGSKPGDLHGKPIAKTTQAAFDHAWFNALAPHYGVVGLSKWAAYDTDKHDFGPWGEVGAPDTGFARTPTYAMSQLFTHAIGPGWQPDALHHGQDQLMSSFKGPNGQSAVFALNGRSRRGAMTLTGLPPGKRYHVAVWNEGGKGGLKSRKPITVAKNGTLTVQVPASGVVALATKPIVA
ncbi:MAG TPA: hypothetical protein V6D47_16270 [Oscillatoriaceae cyanobacterium]